MENSDQKQLGTRYGRVTIVDKHYYTAEFDNGNGSYLVLRAKRKKLNEIQKQLLTPGLPVMADLDTRQVFFYGRDAVWY